MLQGAIQLQQKKVDELELLMNDPNKKEIVFRAPTGSGKTRMMADLMNRVLTKNDVIFIVSAPSAGGIANQNFETFETLYKNGTYPHLNPVLISSETAGEQGIVIPRGYKVYVLPSALLGEGRRITRGGELDNFFAEMIGIQHKNIYVIRDECHTDTTNLNEYSDVFSKIVHVSATPKKTEYKYSDDGKRTSTKVDLVPDVELTDIEAINEKMIKDVMFVKQYDKLDNGMVQSDLEDAFQEFVRVRSAYSKHGIQKTPCLIIQISNTKKGVAELDFIKNAMSSFKQKTSEDLTWAYIASKDKKTPVADLTNDKGLLERPYDTWKDIVKRDESSVEVIIFKMTIKEGYDIPRACMLYQIRNTGSQTLDEQVMGRVRRNPRIADFEQLSPEAQEVCLTAYVWGVKEDSKTTAEVKRAFPASDFLITPTRLSVKMGKKTYDTRQWLSQQKVSDLVGIDIFDAYNDQQSKLSPEMYEEYRDNVETVEDWYKFIGNASSLKAEVDSDFTDYDSSMDLLRDENDNPLQVSFPEYTMYPITNIDEWFADWMWEHTDKARRKKDSDDFCFDSQAEKAWANQLEQAVNDGDVKKASNGIYLIGKNYTVRSDIYFEYYDGTVRKSYPDFVLKNNHDSVHIFESKGMDISGAISLNGDDYQHKIECLKAAYKHASKLTGYHFYIPIHKDEAWTVWWYYNGEEKQITVSDVLNNIKTL